MDMQSIFSGCEALIFLVWLMKCNNSENMGAMFGGLNMWLMFLFRIILLS